jgi:hypothetical protein
MNAKSILTEIYQSKELAATIAKVKPIELQGDIRQHVFCELYGKDESFIAELHERGKLRLYIAKMIRNISRLKSTNSFNRAMGKEIPMSACGESRFEVVRYENEERERQEVESSIACAVAEIYWYKAGILKLYAEMGTYKAVAIRTGIPAASIFRTVKDARAEIKARL